LLQEPKFFTSRELLLEGLASFFGVALMTVIAIVIGYRRKADIEQFFNKHRRFESYQLHVFLD